MLFNHHLNKFISKSSVENRLFHPKNLKNLDQVQDGFQENREACIKLPEISFIIFYNGDSDQEEF